jgi:signal transduction histidine kinase
MRFTRRFWVRLDWAAAVVCGLVVFVSFIDSTSRHVVDSTGSYQPAYVLGPARYGIGLLLAASVSLPVGIRRRDPVRALLLALAGCAGALALGYELSRGPIVPLALVVFTVAATRARKVSVAGLAVSLGLLAAEAAILDVGGSGSGPAILDMLILIIVWMAGSTALQRRSYAARVREQVASAAVTEERLRIARELHDVVAHSMTVVAVQAGFGEYVFEQEPGEARAALGAIQRVTTDALADMQRLLGVLRQGDATVAGAEPARPLQLAPAPGLGDLDRLVSTTAVAGVRVDVASAGELGDLPPAIDQSAFRIVQEALTNVVKHSGAGSCQVRVDNRDGGLCVEVTDPGGHGRVAAGNGAGGASGTGHGIIGMRERVSLCGGEFSAGPLPGQGFRVAARFPLNGVSRSGTAR